MVVGRKRETATATKTEKDTLQSALPVIENAEEGVGDQDFGLAKESDDGTSKPKPYIQRTRLLSLTIQQNVRYLMS